MTPSYEAYRSDAGGEHSLVRGQVIATDTLEELWRAE